MRIVLCLCLCACSKNVFDDLAEKDTNEAIFFQAKRELNKLNYAGAISLMEGLEPAYLAHRERTPIYASAYSGRCGLEFLTMLEAMQSLGSSNIFVALMGGFPGALATNVQDCIDAETIIEGIGDESFRNADENLLMAFNALAKIGTILSSLADADDDSTADAGFDQCEINDFSDNMVRELGSSIAVTILSLAGIGTNYIDGALSEIGALCALDPNLSVFCNTADPSAFTADEVRYLRYVIGSNDVGIDSCGGNDLSSCAAIYEPPGVPECF